MSKKIAIIGGGFSGLSLLANIIALLRENNPKLNSDISISVFEPNNFGGVAYNIALPDDFKLNHEAKYMGVVNRYDSHAKYSDFYDWIQQYKSAPLDSLDGLQISLRYSTFNLDDPDEHLPRSLYGHYLEFRMKEMMSLSESMGISVTHEPHYVKNVEINGDSFRLSYDDRFSIFSSVVLCTGDHYRYDSDKLFYHSRQEEFLESNCMSLHDSIGIIGSSLSAIETALSLSKRGFKKIELYSRNGRLPKVRGKYLHYAPKFLTEESLAKLKNDQEFVDPAILINLLKKEFDYAYNIRKEGLYQELGIHWEELERNLHPLKQLDEDILKAKTGDEVLWRSVLIGLGDIEMDLWRSLSDANCRDVLKNHTSFILAFFSPMPLKQAECLQQEIQRGVISLSCGVKSIDFNKRWVITHKKGKSVVDYLIDARGYSYSAKDNGLHELLIETSILEEHAISGINANNKFQILRNGNALKNFYAVGTILNGVKPLKASTPYISEYTREIANSLVNE